MKYKEKEFFERQAPWWKFDGHCKELLESLADYDDNGHPRKSADIAMCLLLAFEYQDNGDISEEHKALLNKNPLLKFAYEHLTDCMYEADKQYNESIKYGKKGVEARRNKSAKVDALVNSDVSVDNDLPIEI